MMISKYIFTGLLSAALATVPSMVNAAETPTAPLKVWVKEHALNNDDALETAKETRWFDAQKLTLEGKPFADTETPYSRIEKSYKNKVTDGVWGMGLSAAGVAVRFVTDATTISASWDYKPPMNHMALTGSGGLDLYAREGDKWVFRGIGRPSNYATTATAIVQNSRQKRTEGTTEYLMFLPLYSSVTYVKIGIPADATIAPAPPRYEDRKPVVFYGTSITQGGCASRAGMSHPAILRRWLDRPVINFGFSGSGKSEPVMAELLGRMPASLYVLETVPNMTAATIDDRMVSFVKQLRASQPDTPILMIASPNVPGDDVPNSRWRAAYDALVKENIPNLHYLAGEGLYNTEEEATVDGAHPTDLGFYQMAKAYRPVIEKILEQGK